MVKRCLLLLVLPLWLPVVLCGQDESPGIGEAAAQAAQALTRLYGLDAAQRRQMEVIQLRHFRNLASIESLRAGDQRRYLEKKKAFRQGTEASIQRLLRKDQLAPFREARAARRKAESDLIRDLRLKGASPADIEMAVLQLEQG